jgi:hypothetical protein
MGEGAKTGDRRRLATAINTATAGNATAFGSSITITGSFGMLQAVVGSPTVGQIVMFGVAAALTIGIVEGVVTRGFKERPDKAPRQVAMLGTAQDFISVGLAVGTAAAVAALLESGAAWPLGAAAATIVFLVAESLEIFLAELIDRRRDADAA